MRRLIEPAVDQIAPSAADQINAMDDVLNLRIYPFRVTAGIAGFLGGFALVPTISGIHGVMSYLVSRRTKEIGIRVALGAGSGDVIAMVAKQSVRLSAIGAAIGLGLILALARLLASQIEVVNPFDVLAYAGTGALVVLATLAASYYPVRWALRIDPAITLKCD